MIKETSNSNDNKLPFTGQMSNVVKSLVNNRRIASRNELKTTGSGPHHSASSAAAIPSAIDEIIGGTLLDVEKPSTILFYLIAGIVSFIVLCGLIILVILLAFRRRRKKEPTSIDDIDDLDSNGSGGGFSGNGGDSGAVLAGNAPLEIAAMDPETKHFLLGNSNQESLLVGGGPTHSSLIKASCI